MTSINTEINLRVGGVEISALASNTLEDKVSNGLDFLIGHFEGFEEGFIWPRTVSTKATRGAQVLVYSREQALQRFKEANYLDCRISAYPSQKYRKQLKQKPNFLFIDLDDKALN